MFDLKGRVAIVTGGNGGIGLGMARGLAAAGASIVVAARNADKSRRAVAELEGLGTTALAVSVDVTDEAAVARLVAATRERLAEALRSGLRPPVAGSRRHHDLHRVGHGYLSALSAALARNLLPLPAGLR